MRLLSNALAVDLNGLTPSGDRTRDLLFAGRLLPWKAPILALRALRFVEHTDAVLTQTLGYSADEIARLREKRAI